MLSAKRTHTTLLALIIISFLELRNAQEVGHKDLFRCRQSCYRKYVHDWHHCMDFDDCKNCWNNCDQQLGPFPLNINSALRQGSLVLTDIGWDQAITNASKQCLVTWEVSGGGLMGNLLTDSSNVELSLWPDTVFDVQVTCKHKDTGGMRRSFKLIVDTHKLSDRTATGMQPMAIETGIKANLHGMYPSEQTPSSSDTESRIRILKDSSKDFLSPYNPSADRSNGKTVTVKPSTSSPSTTEEGSTIKRTKISTDIPEAYSIDFLMNVTLFAAIVSAVLFIGMVIVSAAIRSGRKETPPTVVRSLDKENLIHHEYLPSQTPGVLAVSCASAKLTNVVATSSSSSSSASSSSLSSSSSSLSASESPSPSPLKSSMTVSANRTLHV